MTRTAIRTENLGKLYRLGLIGSTTLHEDLSRWWARTRRRPDPYARIGDGEHDQSGGRKDLWALQDVSIEIGQGEIWGMIGSNGAGKSTLLKVLSRVTAPTTGAVKMRGRVGSLLEVGTGFHPELTGRENVYLNGAILGMRRSEVQAKFDQIMDFAEVAEFADTPVKRYSSGMFVRLAFAVAAHLEPDILLVDEVLAVGDLAFQEKCLGKMGDVAQHGRTVLFVSHNMGAISTLCPMCIWLDRGRVRLMGKTTEVVPEYVRSTGREVSTGAVFIDSDERREAQISRVRMLFASGEVAVAAECSESLTIEMQLDVRRRLPGLCAYLEVRLPSGTTVLMSDSLDTTPNPLDDLSVGTHVVTATIPPRSLAAGKYDVYVNLTSLGGRTFDVHSPGVVGSFRLHDSTSMRGNARPGFFSTLLQWQATELSRSGD